MFRINEGPADRLIRAVLGVVILIFSYLKITGWFLIVGYVVGTILLITAITGFCMIYTLLGFSTAKEKNQEKNTNEINN